MIVPALVLALLLGPDRSDGVLPVGRVAGIALLSLGLAVRPARPLGDILSPAFWAMLTYNSLIAAYLAYLGLNGAGGMLLWPVVVLHLAMAAVQVWIWKDAKAAT